MMKIVLKTLILLLMIVSLSSCKGVKLTNTICKEAEKLYECFDATYFKTKWSHKSHKARFDGKEVQMRNIAMYNGQLYDCVDSYIEIRFISGVAEYRLESAIEDLKNHLEKTLASCYYVEKIDIEFPTVHVVIKNPNLFCYDPLHPEIIYDKRRLAL